LLSGRALHAAFFLQRKARKARKLFASGGKHFLVRSRKFTGSFFFAARMSHPRFQKIHVWNKTEPVKLVA
jgi:hypothetical protein